MGSSCAHEGSKRPILEMPFCSKGNADASGGASLHINESPYQLAAPVLPNCRASPSAEVARLLGTKDGSLYEAMKDKI